MTSKHYRTKELQPSAAQRLSGKRSLDKRKQYKLEGLPLTLKPVKYNEALEPRRHKTKEDTQEIECRIYARILPDRFCEIQVFSRL